MRPLLLAFAYGITTPYRRQALRHMQRKHQLGPTVSEIVMYGRTVPAAVVITTREVFDHCVGRAQLYRLSLVDAHTVAQNQYTGTKFDNIHLFCHGIVLSAKV